MHSLVASVDGQIPWLLSGRPAISKFELSRGRDGENEPDSVGEESVCFVSFLTELSHEEFSHTATGCPSLWDSAARHTSQRFWCLIPFSASVRKNN